MNSASGVRPEPATALDTAARESRPRKGGDQSAPGFEALLGELGAGREPARAHDDVRPRSTVLGLPGSASLGNAGKPGGDRASEWPVQEPKSPSGGSGDGTTVVTEAATAPDAAMEGVAPDGVGLAVLPEGKALMRQVAGHIVAALDGTRPDGAVSSDLRPALAIGSVRAGEAERTTPCMSLSRPGGDAGSGPELARESLAGVSVTRRETHLAPASSDLADPSAIRDAGCTEGVNSGAERGHAVPRTATTVTARDAATGSAAIAAHRQGPPEATSEQTPRGPAPEPIFEGTMRPSRSAIGTPTGAVGPELDGLRFAAAAPTLRAGPAHVVAGLRPASVLHIRLQPVELGTLEVRMRMTDAGLEVHVEASRHETFALLQRDRDLLAGILRSAGHTIEAVTLSVTDKAAGHPHMTALDGSQPSAPEGRADTQPGAPRERDGRPDGRSPPRPEGGRVNEQVQHDQDRPAVAARRHDSLYL